MTEIKPCPFCKSTSNIPAEHEEWCFLRKRADCSDDYFTAGFGGGEFDWKAAYEHRFDRHSNEELIEAWNTRAERTCSMSDIKTGEQAEYDTEEVIYHCENCHDERAVYAFNEDGNVWADAPNYCPNCGAKVVSE